MPPAGRPLPEGEFKLGVRPEYVSLAAAQAPGALPAQVTQAQDVGTHVMLTAQVGGVPLKARLSADEVLPERGAHVWLQVLGEHTCFYRDEILLA